MANPDGLPYRFVHATHDYGVSPVAKQGIVFHMSEGCNPTAYLSGGNVLRGVSANFTVEADGEVVQMLRLNHTSGSIRIDDVRTDNDDDGFWGRKYTRAYDADILTGKANQRTLSIEIGGKARSKWSCDGKMYLPGPNAAQVKSVITLIETLRAKFLQRLIVNGHRDFADYKACPGEAKGVKDILEAVHHGPEELPPAPEPPEDCDCAQLRNRIRSLKARVEDLEDVLQESAVETQQAYRVVKPYLPAPNQP